MGQRDSRGDDALALVAEGNYTRNELIARSGLSRAHWYREMAAGRLRWVKAGRRRLVPVREVHRYFAERLRGGEEVAKPSLLVEQPLSPQPAASEDSPLDVA